MSRFGAAAAAGGGAAGGDPLWNGGGLPSPPGRTRNFSLGFNELNLNADGTIMSRAQIIEERRRLGLCVTCHDHPAQCFEPSGGKLTRVLKGFVNLVPRTEEGLVKNGTCLRCHPERAPPPTGPNSQQTGGAAGATAATSIGGTGGPRLRLTRGTGNGTGNGISPLAPSSTSGGGRRGRRRRPFVTTSTDANANGNANVHGSGSGGVAEQQQQQQQQQQQREGDFSVEVELIDAMCSYADMAEASVPSAGADDGDKGGDEDDNADSASASASASAIATNVGLGRASRGRAEAGTMGSSSGSGRSVGSGGSIYGSMSRQGALRFSSGSGTLDAYEASGSDAGIQDSNGVANAGVEAILRTPHLGHRRQQSRSEAPLQALPPRQAYTPSSSASSVVAPSYSSSPAEIHGVRAGGGMDDNDDDDDDNLADEDLKRAPPPPPDSTARRLVDTKLLMRDVLAADTPDGDAFAIETVSELMLEDDRDSGSTGNGNGGGNSGKPPAVWSEMQEYGLTVLGLLSRKSSRNKEIIANGRALEAIVKAMTRTAGSSVRAQDFGCRALWSIAVSPRCRKAVADAGGCGRIVSALERHGVRSSSGEGANTDDDDDNDNNDNEGTVAKGDMVKSALGAMKPLTDDEHARDELERHGASSLVSSSMLSHASDHKIQSDGCVVLGKLIVDSANRRVQVGSGEEFAAILGAMRNHASDVAVQKAAVDALRNYAWSDTNASTLSSTDGARELMERAREAFPSECGEVCTGILERMRAAGIEERSVARASAVATEANNGGGEGGGGDFVDVEEEEAYLQIVALPRNPHLDMYSKVVSVYETMIAFMDSLRIQSSGLSGLVELTSSSEEACDVIANVEENGGTALAAVLGAMEVFGADDPSVHRCGCLLLCAIARSSERNRVAVLDVVLRGEVDRVVAAMRHHPSDEGICLAALRALGALTKAEATVAALPPPPLSDDGGGGKVGCGTGSTMSKKGKRLVARAVRECISKFDGSIQIRSEGEAVLVNVGGDDDDGDDDNDDDRGRDAEVAVAGAEAEGPPTRRRERGTGRYVRVPAQG